MRARAAVLICGTFLSTAAAPALDLPPTAVDVDALAEARSALLRNRPAEAEAACIAFLEASDTGTRVDLALIEVLAELGAALALQERPGEARVHLERAFRLQRHVAAGNDLLEAELRYGLARAAIAEERFDQARDDLIAAIGLLGAHAGERLQELARALRELARLELRRGDLVAAHAHAARERELYELALERGLVSIPPQLEQAARDSEGIGGVFRLALLRAAAISSELVWRNDTLLADTLREIATGYAVEGDSGEALRWFERAWLLRPPERFVEGFVAYRAFPEQKAFAMALDARGRWTYGFFTGEPTVQDSVERALAECRRRLPWWGIEADCRLYASNDAVVWEPASIRLGR